MRIILKIIILLTSIAIGFASTSLTFHGAQLLGAFNQAADQAYINAFFQNAIFAWLAGVILSIGYLLISNPLKYICLFSPILAVIIYGLKFVFLSP